MPSFIQSIGIAQVTMISEAYGGKKRDSFFKKLKPRVGRPLFIFFFVSVFFTGNWYESFISIWYINAFSYSVHFFHCLNSALCTKVYFWWNPIYPFPPFNCYAFSAISNKPLLSSRVWRYTPKFSSESVTILAVTFRSLINLGLILGIGVM